MMEFDSQNRRKALRGIKIKKPCLRFKAQCVRIEGKPFGALRPFGPHLLPLLRQGGVRIEGKPFGALRRIVRPSTFVWV